MAAFPNVKTGWRDRSETTDSVVEVSKMERGVPKTRRIASDARVEIALTVYFDSMAQAEAFDDWFFDDINAGADWFSFTLRNGSVVQAHIVDGKLGPLKFENSTLGMSNRSVQIEYWRPSW